MMPAKERKRYIILGWDSSSAQAAKSLAALGMEVAVVSETAPERLEPDVHFVPGAPTEQATLVAAGVERAHTLLLALPADDATAAEGDLLLVLGTESQLTTLSRTADGENI